MCPTFVSTGKLVAGLDEGGTDVQRGRELAEVSTVLQEILQSAFNHSKPPPSAAEEDSCGADFSHHSPLIRAYTSLRLKCEKKCENKPNPIRTVNTTALTITALFLWQSAVCSCCVSSRLFLCFTRWFDLISSNIFYYYQHINTTLYSLRAVSSFLFPYHCPTAPYKLKHKLLICPQNKWKFFLLGKKMHKANASNWSLCAV